MKIDIVLSKPKDSELDYFDRLPGYVGFLNYDEAEYKVQLINSEEKDVLYIFPGVFCWNKYLSSFGFGGEEIEEKLKEYDNPETEIIFEDE